MGVRRRCRCCTLEPSPTGGKNPAALDGGVRSPVGGVWFGVALTASVPDTRVYIRRDSAVRVMFETTARRRPERYQ